MLNLKKYITTWKVHLYLESINSIDLHFVGFHVNYTYKSLLDQCSLGSVRCDDSCGEMG